MTRFASIPDNRTAVTASARDLIPAWLFDAIRAPLSYTLLSRVQGRLGHRGIFHPTSASVAASGLRRGTTRPHRPEPSCCPVEDVCRAVSAAVSQTHR